MRLLILTCCCSITLTLFGLSIEAKNLLQNIQENKKLHAYLNSFPIDTYRIVTVENGDRYLLDAIGPDVIKDVLSKGFIWEKDIQDVLDQFIVPGTLAIDIGAHIGTHAIHMAKKIGPEGQVMAFEPHPKIYRELYLNKELNHADNLLLFPFAISDAEMDVALTIPQGNEGHTHCRPLEKNENSDRVIAVKAITLDSLKLTNISLIKIDVESFEDRVLRGAKETILEQRPVIVLEIMGGYNPHTAPPHILSRIRESLELVESLGYGHKRLDAHNYLLIPIERLYKKRHRVRSLKGFSYHKRYYQLAKLQG